MLPPNPVNINFALLIDNNWSEHENYTGQCICRAWMMRMSWLHKSDSRELGTHFRYKFNTCEFILSFFCPSGAKTLCKNFPGGVIRPTSKSPTLKIRNYTYSCPYTLTCVALVVLPGTQAPAIIALRVILTHKPLHNKMRVLEEYVLPLHNTSKSAAVLYKERSNIPFTSTIISLETKLILFCSVDHC